MNNKNQKEQWENVAEIVMASTVVIELAGKCSGKMKAKRAASGNASITDDKITSYEL